MYQGPINKSGVAPDIMLRQIAGEMGIPILIEPANFTSPDALVSFVGNHVPPVSEAFEKQTREICELQARSARLNQRIAELEPLAALAGKDALTGLANRAGMMAYIGETIKLMQSDQSLAVFLLDADHLKAVNDKGGHEAGDKLISSIGAGLLDFQNEYSGEEGQPEIFSARLGGDEFVIFIKDAAESIQATTVFAGEYIRADVEKIGLEIQQEFQQKGIAIPAPTASIGYSVATSKSKKLKNSDVSKAMRFADLNLYEAKETGRNRVAGSIEIIGTCVALPKKQNRPTTPAPTA